MGRASLVYRTTRQKWTKKQKKQKTDEHKKSGENQKVRRALKGSPV